MPRKVDHEQRRRHIVESLLRITGTQGLEAVSLREVAHEAGVSMGAVQHYFATKDEMLLYALQHWLSLSVHDRFAERVRARLTREPSGEPTAALRAIAAEYLPYDEACRSEVLVSMAFLSRAAVAPALAAALAPAFAGFAHTLSTVLQGAGVSIDAPAEAQRLAALLDGLRLPVLVGALSYQDALAVVDRHLALLPTGDLLA
ncbi:TetR/AcrR family transcriptional regulator [Catellatospora vulcania]|uniref:TetR/AcrR family transcriptional regulator n=1 Tax=Catellatospora vulcania TaxID=1460450 RepID=UPI0012D3AF40|nr:TetR/AcrR family transcriptional regulator [Catellatospora vulcania]